MRKKVLQTASVEVLSIPIGIATGVLTARFLGPDDRGLLTLLLLLPRTITSFGNVGIDTASIYQHRRDNVPIGTLFWNAFIYTVVVAGVAALIVWNWRQPLLGALVARADPWYVIIPLLTVPFLMSVQMSGALARARQDFSTYNRRTLLEKILTLVGLGIVFSMLTGTVWQCLLVFLLIPAVVALWLCWDLRRYLGSGPDLGVFRKSLGFGIKSYFQNLSQHIHHRADLYLVALFLTNAELAFYSIGANLAERVLLVPNSLGMVLFPRLVSSSAADAAQLTARAARHTALFGFATAVPVLLFGEWLIRLLYGSAYLSAAVPMYIVITGVLFIGVTRILMRYITSVNKHQYNALMVLGAAGVNVVLNLALIPRFGIVGAALASLVTYTLQSAFALYVFRQLTGLPVGACIVPTPADVSHLGRVLQEWLSSARRRPAASPADHPL